MGLLDQGLEFSGSNNSQVRVNCPFCQKRGKDTPDEGKHLYIGIANNKFICFRCDLVGDDIYSILPELKYSSDFNTKNLLELYKHEEKKYFDLSVVGEPIQEGDNTHYYLHTRGYTLQDAEDFGILKGINEYRNRIIIPNLELGSNKCDYFIARSISNSTNPKYKNPPSKRVSVLFNYSKAIAYDLGIMAEGWFTGKAFGNNFVAYLGSSITVFQSIKASVFQDLYYCPDGDVTYEKILDNMRMLLMYRRSVRLMPIPRINKLDADNLSIENKRISFNNAREFYKKDLILSSRFKNKHIYARDLRVKSQELDNWYESIFPIKHLNFKR